MYNFSWTITVHLTGEVAPGVPKKNSDRRAGFCFGTRVLFQKVLRRSKKVRGSCVNSYVEFLRMSPVLFRRVVSFSSPFIFCSQRTGNSKISNDSEWFSLQVCKWLLRPHCLSLIKNLERSTEENWLNVKELLSRLMHQPCPAHLPCFHCILYAISSSTVLSLSVKIKVKVNINTDTERLTGTFNQSQTFGSSWSWSIWR